jgi:hypothetical protein
VIGPVLAGPAAGELTLVASDHRSTVRRQGNALGIETHDAAGEATAEAASPSIRSVSTTVTAPCPHYSCVPETRVTAAAPEEDGEGGEHCDGDECDPYDGGCYVCQRWYYIYSDRIVATWECWEGAPADCEGEVW